MRGTELSGLGGEEDTQRKKKSLSILLQLQTGALVTLFLSSLMACGLSQS